MKFRELRNKSFLLQFNSELYSGKWDKLFKILQKDYVIRYTSTVRPTLGDS